MYRYPNLFLVAISPSQRLTEYLKSDGPISEEVPKDNSQVCCDWVGDESDVVSAISEYLKSSAFKRFRHFKLGMYRF